MGCEGRDKRWSASIVTEVSSFSFSKAQFGEWMHTCCSDSLDCRVRELLDNNGENKVAINCLWEIWRSPNARVNQAWRDSMTVTCLDVQQALKDLCISKSNTQVWDIIWLEQISQRSLTKNHLFVCCSDALLGKIVICYRLEQGFAKSLNSLTDGSRFLCDVCISELYLRVLCKNRV